MAGVRVVNGPLVVVAHRGDAKTLLAFDLTTATSRKRLAGFTIHVKPPGSADGWYLRNRLTFEFPERHAQSPNEPAQSSVNAPFHKFRWVHHPGLYHQTAGAAMGEYAYTVTPRYFDDNRSMRPLDPSLGATVKVRVDRYVKGKVAVGFTRGFVQSQAYGDHFGPKVKIEPKGAPLLWDTTQVAGQDAEGDDYTYEDLHRWLGFTARDRLFRLLDDALANPKQTVDLFAYDLNDSEFVRRVLALAEVKRVRVILDNAALHHNSARTKAEDEFEDAFLAVHPDGIRRGKFSRYAHDKVLIVYDGNGAKRVLTGSTNFSTSGLAVNSNHVLVIDDRAVARQYRDVFRQVWDHGATRSTFLASPLSRTEYQYSSSGVPATTITFSPHTEDFARMLLDEIADRVDDEHGSVLFAVMGLEGAADNPVYEVLKRVHQRTDVYSYGISDTDDGIAVYEPGRKTGLLVTGKPVASVMPPPFNKVPGLGFYHQVHHKFVVCGITGDDPVVWCGSSNLALLGEQQNGDNLLEIHDAEIAMVFAIEALELVDHFEFLGRQSEESGAAPADPVPAGGPAAWHLGVTDFWVKKWFDPNDLHSVDRELWVA